MTADAPAARFHGRRVLLTGAGSAIGRACASRLAAEGARLALTDREAPAVEIADAVAGHHLSLAMDVTRRTEVDAAVAAAAEQLGGLDVLVTIAGGDMHHPPFEECDDDVWATMVDLNLMGVVRCCRAAVPHLRRSTTGPAIVITSSVNALTALGSEPYSSAKAGLTALTVNLAAQLGPDGIRVNAVAPATIRTAVWDAQPGGADRMRPLYPLGRVGEPSDVAAAVAFLTSDDAAWVTGHTLPVDGGLLTGPGRMGLPAG